MQTRIHTYLHSFIESEHAHTPTHTNIYVPVQTSIYPYSRLFIKSGHAHMYVHTHVHMQTHIHAYLLSPTRTYMHATSLCVVFQQYHMPTHHAHTHTPFTLTHSLTHSLTRVYFRERAQKLRADKSTREADLSVAISDFLETKQKLKELKVYTA